MIRFRPEAAAELLADVHYYDTHHPGRGGRFAEAVDQTLHRITESPDSFPLLFEPDIRSAKVDEFPYRIVYVVVDRDIDVLAVAHAKRRPAYWRRRVT